MRIHMKQLDNSEERTSPVTHRQFPLRLELSLADELDRMSAETNINKSTITRIAIQKFLAELKTSGARDAVKQVCSL